MTSPIAVLTKPELQPYLYIYRLDPIDWWTGWHRAKDIVKLDFGATPFECSGIEASTWETMWFAARLGAALVGWEGDIRGDDGPYISMLPELDSGGECRIIIGWKQDNNGTTFIASQIPLPHLMEKTEVWNRDWCNWVIVDRWGCRIP